MDLQLVRKGLLRYTQRNKRLVLMLVALGFSSYGAYKVYNFPSIAQKRRRISKLFEALVSMAEVVSDSAETIGVFSREVKDFLQSESDEIPNSLRQVSKIAKSNEFSESVVTLAQALTIGILRGYQSNSRSDHDFGTNSNCPSFLDKVFDKLSTPAGTGFVSSVVGSFAKNMVMAYFRDGKAGERFDSNFDLNNAVSNDDVGQEMDSVSRFVDVVCGDKCKVLIGDSIQLFVSTAVAVYLDKTMDINTYDEIFAGMTNPKHETKVRDVLVSVCNGAVETLVKTSHRVLTSDDSNANSNVRPPLKEVAMGNGKSNPEAYFDESKDRNSFDEGKDSGWVNKVSLTLAVPSNRKLVLDLTGKVTFETVRSFLEFVLEKLYDGIKRCFNIVHEVIVDNSIAVVRYVSAKSSIMTTLCLSLCLRMIDGAWILVPA